MNSSLLNPYDEAKQRLAEGVKALCKDHEDTFIYDGRLYRIRIERLRDPEEIEAAIRQLTKEAAQ